MTFRPTVLLLALFAATSLGQATPPAASRSGAGPSRANGATPTAPGLNNTGSSRRTPAGNRNTRGKQPPAPAANGQVEVIGRPAQNQTGTVDHPLLPIVSAGNGLGIRSGTPIHVLLKQAIDSGHAHNGDMLDGTLAQPLAGLPAGTPVQLTVVAVAAAGQLSSFGELSVQVVSIAGHTLLSDTATAQGREGAKELPDAAPARGTEAIFQPGVPLTLPAA